MGGGRCSYQNCSQKSDKKTHMFHYPVFDKMRCHQWITNAHKLNYLDLKVSQLKNRMVCEHHFTDDCFMNARKNKLKNNAIPTEDGPYCSIFYKEKGDKPPDNKESEPLINIDDIENEFMPQADRRAHFSVKYGDFLTNDVTEAITLTPDYKSTSIKLQDSGMIFNRRDRKLCSPQNNQTSHKSIVKRIILTRANRADNISADKAPTFENKLPDPKVVAIEADELNLNASEQNQTSLTPEVLSLTPPSSNSSQKIRILSEKHISAPVKIPPGELQSVSPSIVIEVPDKKKTSNIEMNGREIKTLYANNILNFESANNVQLSDSTMATYIHTPRVPAPDQTHLNAYTQPKICHVDEISFKNVAIQKVDPVRDIQPMDYLISGANQNSQQLEETGLLSNIDHNMSTARPNVELVSLSLTDPSVFTLTDVPQVKASPINSSYSDNKAAKHALLSMDSEIITANQQVSSVPMTTVHAVIGNTMQSKNIQPVLNEKPISKSSSPNKSMIRYKMRPEKLAAIEEKRKYNMKLRDIINSCLNNMDDEPDAVKLSESIKKDLSNKKVGEHIYDNSNRPSAQEVLTGYLETRLQRMEDNLLNKIEQNSLRITELKRTFKRQVPNKKTGSTQTYFSVAATKKSLYEQVSKYLTPGTNSLIYEELFINQCVSKIVPNTRKRRYNNNDTEL